MGAQSYSFREFGFEDSIRCLKELGQDEMEFCAVHFKPDATAPNFAQVKDAIARAGIRARCFGVEGFTGDAAANRRKFEFAEALGVEVITADPTPDSFDNLDVLCEEFHIQIAIHNHGPGARYDKVADTLSAVKGRGPLIGACVDTGHVIRSGEKPQDVIEALGERVLSLHLKDWALGAGGPAGVETILGEGDLDMVAVGKALKAVGFKGPVMMEYEESPKKPVPDMRKGWANWTAALARVEGV